MLVLTKGNLPDSSSAHAQGGVAGAIGDDDTADLHAIDTEHAGRELCRPSAVRVLVILTNEELAIARRTYQTLAGAAVK